MANTRFQHKRSSISNVVPTTSDIAVGELGLNLADRKLFTSNGSVVFELGSNLSNIAISGNVTIGASGDLVLTPGAGIFANGGLGTDGQVLHSNGSSVYWSTGGATYSAVITEQFTANGTANTFTVTGGYIPNAIEVYVAGVKQVPGTDVDVSSGSTINLTVAPLNGQIVDVFGFVSVGSVVTQGTVTSVESGNGLSGGPITSSGTLSIQANNGITANSTGLFVTQGTGTVVNSTGVHVNTAYIGTLAANSASFLGGNSASDLRTYSEQQAGNAYSNAVANAAALYQTTAGLSANVATLTANNSTNLGGQPASFYTNASNITTGTLPMAQLASNVVNTTAAFTISGLHTHTANVHMGNTTVNTQQSNATILISNSTTTTTVSLTDIRLGNSTVNTFINASGLTTAANVLINATGELVISPGAGIFANGSLGTSGQVLSSNGTSIYWGTVTAGVNTAAQFAWTNTHSFAANLTIGATSQLIIANGAGIQANGSLGTTGQVLSSNGTSVYWGTAAAGGVRSISIATASTITPTSDTADQYNVTALASSPATIAAPSGAPTNGQKLVIRLKDDGTGRTLNWTTTSGGYRAIGVTLPNTTVANKTTYVGCIYNATDTFWDVVASVTEA